MSEPPQLPNRDDRARAEALEQRLGAPPSPSPSRSGAHDPEIGELADLASELRAALPLPSLPTGGAMEVRAAALAYRAASRRAHGRPAMAAAIALVIGVAGGGTLGAVLMQSSATGGRLALATKYFAAAQQAYASHEASKGNQDVVKAYNIIRSQGSSLPPTAVTTPPSTGNSAQQLAQLDREINDLKAKISHLKAELAAAPAVTTSTIATRTVPTTARPKKATPPTTAKPGKTSTTTHPSSPVTTSGGPTGLGPTVPPEPTTQPRPTTTMPPRTTTTTVPTSTSTTVPTSTTTTTVPTSTSTTVPTSTTTTTVPTSTSTTVPTSTTTTTMPPGTSTTVQAATTTTAGGEAIARAGV